MPRFSPFRGVRYDAAVDLDRVIAPPYDVVNARERSTLAARSPENAIHLELPEPDAERDLDRYENAAHLFHSWSASGALVQDARPALYGYRMTTREGIATTGVIGALGIGDDVLAHEETMPKPKSDRLDLLRATKANLSPIWGLSLAHGLTDLLGIEGKPTAAALDDDGVHHELWVIDDADTIAALERSVASAPVVLADGHHRYETARAYQAEAGSSRGDRDAVMAFVVELAEGQLHVRAIHRLLSNLPRGVDLAQVFSPFFEVERASGPTREVAGRIGASGASALVTRAGVSVMTARPEALEEAGTDLDSRLVELALKGIEGVEVSYDAQLDDALALLEAERADAVVLVRPATVAQISSWAAARRRMPAKTTYFVPKPRTGMVFRLLSDDA